MRKDGQIKEKAAWPSALSRTLSAVELKPVSGSLQSVGLKLIKPMIETPETVIAVIVLAVYGPAEESQGRYWLELLLCTEAP